MGEVRARVSRTTFLIFPSLYSPFSHTHKHSFLCPFFVILQLLPAQHGNAARQITHSCSSSLLSFCTGQKKEPSLPLSLTWKQRGRPLSSCSDQFHWLICWHHIHTSQTNSIARDIDDLLDVANDTQTKSDFGCFFKSKK